MKVLHVTPSYWPATYFGGPIFSTYALCNALASMPGIQLRVLTSDMAGPSLQQRIPAYRVPMRYREGYDVYIARRILRPDIAPGLLARLWELISWADVVLLTATYSFPTLPTLLICRIKDKPVVWSPRGALQASHQWTGVKRRLPKAAFEAVCGSIKPRRAVLHTTADIEKVASTTLLPQYPAVIISNGVEVPQLADRVWRPNGALRLMFISRLDPKKGLERLLSTLPLLPDFISLDIYGTGDERYVDSLRCHVDKLQIGRRVHFHGHVNGEQREAAFNAADIFVFPTFSENFGMVVAEALARGIPVIVSHGAPWPELDSRGCGRWVENSPEALASSIMEIADLNLPAMGARGREWMKRDFSWESKAAEMSALFDSLIEAGHG